MRRRISLCSAIGLIAATVGIVTAGPVAAADPIAYSGRGIALSGNVAGVPVGFADTLPLPSTGGDQDAGVISAGVPFLLDGDTLHAATVGRNDRTRTEASAAGISITAGGDSIEADFAMSRTMAVSVHGAPVLSGSAQISNLVVNDVAVTVTGQANQVVPLPDGDLVVNEQITSTSGPTGSITVNALHLTLTDNTDLLVASSRAGVTAGSSNCSGGSRPTSGGGWILAPTGGKGSFGVMGRTTNNGFAGHVVYTDHGTGAKVRGPVTLYEEIGNAAILRGPAEVNGVPAGDFTVQVQDNGEPGNTDTFSISTTGGSPPQEAGGPLQGGNIQLHKPCR